MCGRRRVIAIINASAWIDRAGGMVTQLGNFISFVKRKKSEQNRERENARTERADGRVIGRWKMCKTKAPLRHNFRNIEHKPSGGGVTGGGRVCDPPSCHVCRAKCRAHPLILATMSPGLSLSLSLSSSPGLRRRVCTREHHVLARVASREDNLDVARAQLRALCRD